MRNWAKVQIRDFSRLPKMGSVQAREQEQVSVSDHAAREGGVQVGCQLFSTKLYMITFLFESVGWF
jgi:hypothetical protein